MRCVQCDGELAAGSRFCHACGAPQTQTCASCSSELPLDARVCTNCGATVRPASRSMPDLSSGALLGADAERRQLTVMFCDLAGSTEASRKLDAEDLRALVKEYQRASAAQIQRFGGYIAQYLGDGILVYFGYPQAHEDAAARAVAAGLAIVRALEKLSAEIRRDRGVSMDVRIGLHTGVVVIGEMGGGGHTQRLAVGDAPNIAARIQARAALNQVLISESTARLVERHFICDSLGAFELKGIDRPATLYRVTGERSLEEHVHEQVGAQVNRSNEVESLLQSWEAATLGAGKAILLTGEAGIGKSSVLRFLLRQLGPRTAYRLVQLRFSEHHRQSAYWAFVDQMSRACGFEASDDNARRVAKLVQRLEALGQELSSYLGVYGSLLALQLSPELDPGPAPTKPLTNLALEQWVLAHASESPLLLEVEDLHWADPSSLEVISRLTHAVPSRRALLLMTARGEFEPPWEAGNGTGVVEIPLGRMAKDHISEIIGNTAQGTRLPEHVVKAMLERIDGVPIFAEELTKAVLDSDVLKSAHGDRELAIPATLHDSLMARLDRISDFRGVVQMCAVMGREFDLETLQVLSGLEVAVLERVLDQLTERQIVFRTGSPGEGHYAFRHVMLRDVAYSSLLRSDRAALHLKMGELLEQRLAEAGAEGAYTAEVIRGLAYHWSHAVSEKRSDPAAVRKALQYLTMAGERELMLSGYKEAGAHLERAMELLMTLPAGQERDELELTVRARISTVRKATVGPAAEEVRVELVRCHELCERIGNRPELGSVLYSFWQLNLFRALYPESLRYAQLCLAEAQRSGDPDMLIQSYVALSNTYFWFCDLKQAEESYKKVLAYYDPAKHGHHALFYGMDPGVLALMFGTWVPQITGRWAEAARRHAEVVRLSADLRHALSMALALNTSCCYHVNRGDHEGAREAGQAMIDLARLHGLFVYEIIGIHFRGWGAAKAGQVDQVIDEVRGTYKNYVTHVGGLAQTYIAMLAAGVFEEAGELDEAIETIDRVLAVAESDHCRELAYHAELLRIRGELLARVGREDEALGVLQTALDLAAQRGQPPFALRAAVGMLRIAERRSGDLTAARALVREQLARFGPDEHDEELDRARALVG